MLSPNHPRCSNCGVTDSPLWRRDPEGNTVCNACGKLFSSIQSHNPLCFVIGPLFGGVGLDTCLPDATVNLLISFQFSLYPTFKEGGCTSCFFLLLFLHYNAPKSRVQVLAYSQYGSTACNALSMLIRLLQNHHTGLSSNS